MKLKTPYITQSKILLNDNILTSVRTMNPENAVSSVKNYFLSYKESLGFSIIIPAYNEEDRIGPILEGLTKNDLVREIIVIFDGNDRTEEVAQSYGEKVIVHSYNSKLGRGGAILEGLKKARFDIVAFADADNAAPWYEVIRLCKMVSNDSPCIIGSRYTRNANLVKRESLFKIFAGRTWHYLIFLILGLKYKDVQCGLKCFKRDLIQEVLPKITITNRLFDIGLLYNIEKMGYKIEEVGIDYINNEDSRMPYFHMIPVMFLYLFGIKVAHTSFGQRLNKYLKKASSKLNQMH